MWSIGRQSPPKDARSPKWMRPADLLNGAVMALGYWCTAFGVWHYRAMGTFFGGLKEKLISKLITSLLPKYISKYEGDIKRVVLAVNMLIAALYVALPTLPDNVEGKVSKELDYINTKWKRLLSLARDYLNIELSDK
jgi:hypothetical protein